MEATTNRENNKEETSKIIKEANLEAMITTLKNREDRKVPQKIRSKKRRRAAAKVARNSRKTNK